MPWTDSSDDEFEKKYFLRKKQSNSLLVSKQIQGFNPTFIRLSSDTNQTLEHDDSVSFDYNDMIFGSAYHLPGSTKIHIWEPGYYNVYYSLFINEPAQISCFLNGIIISGTTNGSPKQTANSSEFIMNVSETNVLFDKTKLPLTETSAVFEIKNHSSYISPIHLITLPDSGPPVLQNIAVLNIVRIA